MLFRSRFAHEVREGHEHHELPRREGVPPRGHAVHRQSIDIVVGRGHRLSRHVRGTLDTDRRVALRPRRLKINSPSIALGDDGDELLPEPLRRRLPADVRILLASSPGMAEDPVFIVRSSDDFASFPPGAVLVARTTNPAWTPLFHAACALVTESGGPLSQFPAAMPRVGWRPGFRCARPIYPDGRGRVRWR